MGENSSEASRGISAEPLLEDINVSAIPKELSFNHTILTPLLP